MVEDLVEDCGYAVGCNWRW